MENPKDNSEEKNESSIIDKIKAKIMLEELKLKYLYIYESNVSDEDLIKKIIELNFDEERIILFYDDKISKIYDDLDQEFGISGFIME